jgi:hypothetical protein
MDVKVLARYGHHIRIVKSMKEHNHIAMLIVSNASKIRRLSITMTATYELYAHFSDLLRRINTSVEYLDIVASVNTHPPPGTTTPFFAVDSLFPTTSTGATSRLSSIKIKGLAMTRDAFSSLLKICPALTRLDIRNTALQSWPIYDQSGIDWYQHTGITDLVAPVDQVFWMNTQSKTLPSLLVHFPNLTGWQTWNTNSPIGDFTHYIRDEVAKHCPSLKRLFLETDAPTSIDLLTEVFHNVTAVCILAEHLSAETVMAILSHHDTLVTLTTFTPVDGFFESEAIPEVGKINTRKWIVLSPPQHCARLRTLSLHSFEVEMKDIEKVNWVCYDLESLHIRIRGLDTKEKIDRAIQLWKDGRDAIRAKQIKDDQEEPCASPQQESIIPASDGSIEACVARHLLKFKKLREVWLGWKVRTVV